MDRFETIRDTTLSKYRMMARPQARSAPTTAAAAAVHECMPVKGGRRTAQSLMPVPRIILHVI
jgi:hypothetical protein